MFLRERASEGLDAITRYSGHVRVSDITLYTHLKIKSLLYYNNNNPTENTYPSLYRARIYAEARLRILTHTPPVLPLLRIFHVQKVSYSLNVGSNVQRAYCLLYYFADSQYFCFGKRVLPKTYS